jgi:hypothetical protein
MNLRIRREFKKTLISKDGSQKEFSFQFTLYPDSTTQEGIVALFIVENTERINLIKVFRHDGKTTHVEAEKEYDFDVHEALSDIMDK